MDSMDACKDFRRCMIVFITIIGVTWSPTNVPEWILFQGESKDLLGVLLGVVNVRGFIQYPPLLNVLSYIGRFANSWYINECFVILSIVFFYDCLVKQYILVQISLTLKVELVWFPKHCRSTVLPQISAGG